MASISMFIALSGLVGILVGWTCEYAGDWQEQREQERLDKIFSAFEH